MEPPLKNNAITDDITNISNMNKHADNKIDKDLFKIIRCTKQYLYFYYLNNLFKI